ncbi:hypothetical protein MRX96_031998 [Rhipicephalus microplus]
MFSTEKSCSSPQNSSGNILLSRSAYGLRIRHPAASSRASPMLRRTAELHPRTAVDRRPHGGGITPPGSADAVSMATTNGSAARLRGRVRLSSAAVGCGARFYKTRAGALGAITSLVIAR